MRFITIALAYKAEAQYMQSCMYESGTGSSAEWEESQDLLERAQSTLNRAKARKALQEQRNATEVADWLRLEASRP